MLPSTHTVDVFYAAPFLDDFAGVQDVGIFAVVCEPHYNSGIKAFSRLQNIQRKSPIPVLAIFKQSFGKSQIIGGGEGRIADDRFWRSVQCGD